MALADELDDVTVAPALIESVPMPSSPAPPAVTSAASVRVPEPLLTVTPVPTVTAPVACSVMAPPLLRTLPLAVNGALRPRGHEADRPAGGAHAGAGIDDDRAAGRGRQRRTAGE